MQILNPALQGRAAAAARHLRQIPVLCGRHPDGGEQTSKNSRPAPSQLALCPKAGSIRVP